VLAAALATKRAPAWSVGGLIIFRRRIDLALKMLLCEPTVFRDPSFGCCLRIKFAEVAGRALRPGHLHSPMTLPMNWTHYNKAYAAHEPYTPLPSAVFRPAAPAFHYRKRPE